MEVYLIQNTETLRVKIGHSSKIESRRYSLQTASAEKLIIIARFSSKFATKIETTLHRFFQDKRKEGEWFEYISKEEFLEHCEKIHNNLTFISENSVSDRLFF